MMEDEYRGIILRGGPLDGAQIAAAVAGGWYRAQLRTPLEPVSISSLPPSPRKPIFDDEFADYRASGKFHEGREVFDFIPRIDPGA